MKTIIIRSLVASSLAVSAASLAQSSPDPADRYMSAKDAPLATLENGAIVSADTKAYRDLPASSPQRASYDRETSVAVAPGIWTFNAASIVNVHAIEGP